MSLKSIHLAPERADVLRTKRIYGIMYGIVVGLAFSASMWGIDGYLLDRANAFYPWLNFAIGAIICMVVGGAAGWLVAILEKVIYAPIIYIGAILIFSWLAVNLPFQIFPKAVTWLDPDTGNLLNYILYENFDSRLTIARIWVALFTVLAAILQIPLTEPAAFSTSYFSKIMPLIVCSIIMIINGIILDKLINEPMRLAILELNNTIQFTVDHQGEEVDKALARTMRTSSLRAVGDVITQPRQLIVGNYDQWLGQIDVLVLFGDRWVTCAVVYNQPSFCQYLTPNSP